MKTLEAVAYRIAYAVGFLLAIPLLPVLLLRRSYREGFARGMREEIAKIPDGKLALYGVAMLWGGLWLLGHGLWTLWLQVR